MNFPPVLLADPSTNLRRLVLLELFGRPETDAEVRELEAVRSADPPAAELFALQQPDGSWGGSGFRSGGVFATSMALIRLGWLGFGAAYPAVRDGSEYLFSKQKLDGSWPLPRKDTADNGDPDEAEMAKDGYAMIPLQTAIPLRAVAVCGLAEDQRAEKAYEWLLDKKLDDGAWPTGLAKSGVFGRVAGYRRLAHSRWGCRSNTTAALLCLSLHPKRRAGGDARRALDQLLGRETHDAWALGFETARLLGAEKAGGFFTFHARFDLAILLSLCAAVGAPLSDPRVKSVADFVLSLKGEFGLWEYARKPQVSRWISFDLYRSLARLRADNPDWENPAPRTPFSPYPKKLKRF